MLSTKQFAYASPSQTLQIIKTTTGGFSKCRFTIPFLSLILIPGGLGWSPEVRKTLTLVILAHSEVWDEIKPIKTTKVRENKWRITPPPARL